MSNPTSSMIKIPAGTKALTAESRLSIGDVLYQPFGSTGEQFIQLVRLNNNTVQLVFIYSDNKELWSSAFHQVPYTGKQEYVLGVLRDFCGYNEPMYLVKLNYGSDAVVPDVKSPSEYLRSGALFVGTKGKTSVTELFRLNVKNEPPIRKVLYTLTRLSDNAIQSFYIPKSITNNKEFTDFITSHSDEFSNYRFKRVTDTKGKED